MTPAGFYTYCSGYLEHEKAAKEKDLEWQNAISYNLASLISHLLAGKRLPKYKPLFRKDRREAMTDEELYKTVCALNILMGGETTEM